MKCLNCGYSLLEDSMFCPYCGTKQAQAQAQAEKPEMPEVPESMNLHTAVPESMNDDAAKELPEGAATGENAGVPAAGVPVADPSAADGSAGMNPFTQAVQYTKPPHKYCKRCGGLIDPVTKRCSVCNKQPIRLNAKVLTAVLGVLLVLSIGLNTVLGVLHKKTSETADSQARKIETLEEQVASLNSTISSQESTIDSFKDKANFFDSISEALGSENLGYASESFNVSESIIVVKKNETGRKFTLTTDWDEGGAEISVNYSNHCATVSFDKESWLFSTSMTVRPLKPGVTTVTFSNTKNSETFKMLIVVVDE